MCFSVFRKPEFFFFFQFNLLNTFPFVLFFTLRTVRNFSTCADGSSTPNWSQNSNEWMDSVSGAMSERTRAQMKSEKTGSDEFQCGIRVRARLYITVIAVVCRRRCNCNRIRATTYIQTNCFRSSWTQRIGNHRGCYSKYDACCDRFTAPVQCIFRQKKHKKLTRANALHCLN